MNRRLASIVVNVLLVALAVISLGPLLWMLSVSFMQTGEAGHFPPPLLPADPTLDNYRTLFQDYGIGRYAFNSLLVSVLANVVADWVWYAAGRHYGSRIMRLVCRV